MENFTCDFVFKNHAIINLPRGCKAYCSYDRIIAFKSLGTVWLTRYYNYSVTTKKRLNKMLNVSNRELDGRIKSGEYLIVDDLTEIILQNIC